MRCLHCEYNYKLIVLNTYERTVISGAASTKVVVPVHCSGSAIFGGAVFNHIDAGTKVCGAYTVNIEYAVLTL